MRLQTIKWFAAICACWPLVLPAHLFAAETANRPAVSTIIRDVALLPGGRMHGRVVDESGQPAETQVMVLDRQGREVRSARSNSDGEFTVNGLSAGTYHVATSAAVVPCRVWAHQTAPPAATKKLLLVEDPAVMRGQRPIGELLFSQPVLLGLIIAAAIAIPIAVHNSKDNAS